MASIICPPYDVISPEEQKAYYKKHQYNVIHVEHPMESPDDTETDNKYTRAAGTFSEWLKNGILEIDTIPTYYIHEHSFEYGEDTKVRMGLIACVHLEPWEKNIIIPHEYTIAKVKADRLQLMRACAANSSPIFGLYEDPGQRIAKLMQGKLLDSKLLFEIKRGSETHRVWKANEPEFVQRVNHFMVTKSIYIADGHHRYETALDYRDERRQRDAYTGDETYNYVMMTLISFSDPGLLIMPIHRLLKNLPDKVIHELPTKLQKYFEVTSLPLTGNKLPYTQDASIMALGLEPGRVLTLKLRPGVSLHGIMPEDRPESYKKLEVSVVQHVILEHLMGITGETDMIAYTPNTEHAMKLVEAGDFQLSFLLNPIPSMTIKAIADAKDRMPRKSTFFHPKLPTGLVMNRLDGTL